MLAQDSKKEEHALASLLRQRIERDSGAAWTIAGTSMGATFRPGDEVRIQAVDREIIPGDVVVVWDRVGKNIAAHRVIHCDDRDRFVLKGDNNARRDPLHMQDQLLGIVDEGPRPRLTTRLILAISRGQDARSRAIEQWPRMNWVERAFFFATRRLIWILGAQLRRARMRSSRERPR